MDIVSKFLVLPELRRSDIRTDETTYSQYSSRVCIKMGTATLNQVIRSWLQLLGLSQLWSDEATNFYSQTVKRLAEPHRMVTSQSNVRRVFFRFLLTLSPSILLECAASCGLRFPWQQLHEPSPGNGVDTTETHGGSVPDARLSIVTWPSVKPLIIHVGHRGGKVCGF